MRLVLAVTFVMLSCVPMQGDHPDAIFLMIGQSNQVGRAPLESGDEAVIEGCLLWNGKSWEPARAGFNRYSTYRKPGSPQGMNPGPSFVRTWFKSHPGRTAGIVCWARGGTSIEQWHPEHDKPWPLYDEAVRQTHAAIKSGGTLAGILWHQGEQNAGRAAKYPKLLAEHVARLRKEFHDPGLPFVFSQVGQ